MSHFELLYYKGTSEQQQPDKNGQKFGVPRAVVVHRFDCTSYVKGGGKNLLSVMAKNCNNRKLLLGNVCFLGNVFFCRLIILENVGEEFKIRNYFVRNLFLLQI